MRPARPPAGTVRRLGALLVGQVRYANRAFWRAPVAAVLTLALPLVLLVLVGLLAGNATIEARSGVRVAQFYTPVAAVFATVMASFATPAIATAVARERGVLKRLQGSPLPMWVYVVGKVGAAAAITLVGVAALLAVGVAFYHVELLGRTLPAALVTLLVGIVTFAALGLAVVAVLPSSQAVGAVTIGAVIVLGFVSDMFGVAEQMPAWLDWLAWALPLRHFVNAFADTFNPFLSGNGLAWDHLAVMAAWGIAGAIVALRRLSWEPPARGAAASARMRRQPSRPRRGGTGRVPLARLLLEQVHYADRVVWRDRGSTFFTVLFPILLLGLLPLVIGEHVVISGMPLPRFLVPAMAAYSVAVSGYVNLPEGLAAARDRGVLKRLRGTPLPVGAYLVGRAASALWIALITVVVLLVVARLAYGVQVTWSALPMLLVILAAGTACLAALGFAVVGLVSDLKTVTAVTLATLLPLGFISDIFPVGGGLPPILELVGWVFPLKHLSRALAETLYPSEGLGLAWDHLGALAAWGAAGALVAIRRFRWEPHARCA